MAKFYSLYRSTWFGLVSACHFAEFDTCNLHVPCVYALSWLIYIARYIFKSLSILLLWDKI